MNQHSDNKDNHTGFKKGWEKKASSLENHDVERIVSAVYPNQYLSYYLPTQGCANILICVKLKTGVIKVLRVYARDAATPEVEKAVLDRVAGVLPVPKISQIMSVDGYQVAECDYIQGERLSDVLLDLPVLDLKRLMHDLGKSLGAISQWGYGKAGIIDAQHHIVQSLDCQNFADETLSSLKAKKRLSQSMISSWETVFQQLSAYFPMPHEDRLVHGDFDPANILVIQKDTKWAISGILDWEFAHAGSPMQDIASMLRDRERLPAEYAEGFLEGVRQSLNIPDHWEITVNVCNALALLDCLNRTHPVDQPNRLSDILARLSRLYDQLS